ncbi:MAG: hypothetical protein HY365_02830 [Candidatus Aenigmarchaeota archaeon]|nr:hypothetical protein [Candidatus Aenigmarchaeota archaeon]
MASPFPAYWAAHGFRRAGATPVIDSSLPYAGAFKAMGDVYCLSRTVGNDRRAQNLYIGMLPEKDGTRVVVCYDTEGHIGIESGLFDRDGKPMDSNAEFMKTAMKLVP